MGIEALSRGAAHATFVERSTAALDALRRNLGATGFVERSDVVAANVIGFLDRGALAARADLAFVDPPFADVAILEATIAHANLSASLTSRATVVARVLRKHPPTLPERVELTRTRRIGEEDLLFLRYRDAGGGG
jgi:16S rRNA (guanine966-N2)-methyltransferase